MKDFAEVRDQMVNIQLAKRDIAGERVLDVFRKVPRHLFVKEQLKDNAYGDFPLPIGCGQTISQPYMVALMTQCLSLSGNEKVLEIGTGSGYQTAILAELAKEVYTIERYQELADHAQSVFKRLSYNNITAKVGDGTLGWQEHSPYQGIIVTAGAPEVPKSLKAQLADGGKLVIPIGGRYSQCLLLITRKKNKYEEQEICGCMFVPLVGKNGWKGD